jgi:hypothetical protein
VKPRAHDTLRKKTQVLLGQVGGVQPAAAAAVHSPAAAALASLSAVLPLLA